MALWVFHAERNFLSDPVVLYRFGTFTHRGGVMNRIVSLFFTVLLCAALVNAQYEMREDPEYGGAARQREFFARLHAPYRDGIPPEVLDRMWQEIHALPSEDAPANPSGGWQCIGPFGFDVSYSSPTRWMGRVLDMELYGPLMRFAAASGGLWEAWLGAAPLSDNLTSLVIGSFASKSTDRNTIIVGTGEQGWPQTGTGLWKTTDGGASWQQVLSSVQYVNKVRYDQIAPFVYAATNQGFYRSTDDGQTWTRTLAGTVWDFAFAVKRNELGQAEPRIFAIRTGIGVWKSSDFGVTWSQVTNGLPRVPNDRGAISAATPPYVSSTIYATLSPPRGTCEDCLLGIYKSTDGGDTWSNVLSSASITPCAPNECPPGSCSYIALNGARREDYNNTIGVCPTNPNIVLVGWMKLFRTSDGGASWQCVDNLHPLNHARTHDDWHSVLWTYGSRVYGANDGGIFYSDDYGVTWGPALAYNNAPITQFYHVDASRDWFSIIYGGAQDVGIVGTTDGGGGWLGTICCDGAGTAVDYSGYPVYAAAGSLPRQGKRYQSTDYGLTWTQIHQGDNMRPGEYVRLSGGGVSWVYIDSANCVLTSDNIGNWSILGGQALPATITNFTVGNWLGGYGAEVYACLSNNQLWVNSQGTWQNRSAGLPPYPVHKVAIHPVYTSVGYALMEGISPALNGNKIFKTIDRGVNWINITGNLPNIPITDLVAHPNNPNLLYLGSEMGCYKSEDDGATWKRWNFGMPEANIITEMSYIDSTSFPGGKFYIVAGSYGRSIWKREASTDDPRRIRYTRTVSIPITGGSHGLDTMHIPPPPMGGGIRKVTLLLDSLLFSYDGDLVITLLHNGVRDTLVNRVGGEGRNFIATLLDDEATQTLAQGIPPFTGMFRPDQPLTVFNGLVPDGDWILDVHATRSGQTGELRSWAMTIAYGSTSSVHQLDSQTPVRFALHQNYPNPFNPSTTIGYELPRTSKVELQVYNVIGQRVATLVNEEQQPGHYSVVWNGYNDRGEQVAGGVYFYRLKAGETNGGREFLETKKLLLLR